MTDHKTCSAEILPIAECTSWNNLVEGAEAGTLFHEEWYLAHLGIECVLVIREGEQVVAGMPIFDRDNAKASRQDGLMVAYGGPFFARLAQDERAQMLAARRAQRTLIKALQREFSHLQFTLAPEHGDIVPFLQSGFFPEVRYTYRCHEPLQIADMSKGRRSDAARFARSGATIIEDPELAYFDMATACRWCDDQSYEGKSSAIARDAVSRGKGRAYVAMKDTNVLGGLFVMGDAEGVFSTHSYYAEEGQKAGVSTALYRHAIDAHFEDPQAGPFDFEGSVLPGVEEFYQSFGARQTPYFGLHWRPDPTELKLEALYDY